MCIVRSAADVPNYTGSHFLLAFPIAISMQVTGKSVVRDDATRYVTVLL